MALATAMVPVDLPEEKAAPKPAAKPEDVLYSIMQSVEGKLGGGEGTEGVYGSITQMGMQKVLDVLRNSCGLDSRSVFIDIGAGLGRPLLHAHLSYGVSATWGVELDRVKCDKAAAFGKQVLAALERRGVIQPGLLTPPALHCKPVEQMESLDPATHVYSFWEGVPLSGKQGFGQLFAKSKTLKAVAVVQRSMRAKEPALEMEALGFGKLLLITSFPVKMSGSGRSFTAYVFSKVPRKALQFFAAAVPAQQAAEPASCVEKHAGAAGAGEDAEAEALPATQRCGEPSTQQALAQASPSRATVQYGGSGSGIAPAHASPTKKTRVEAAPEPEPASPTSGAPGPLARGRQRRIDDFGKHAKPGTAKVEQKPAAVGADARPLEPLAAQPSQAARRASGRLASKRL